MALGLCLGLGALSKYQAAVAALCVFVFWLSQRGWRDPMQVFGLQVAALTALAVFFPHLYWLIEHNFEPLGYAMSSSLGADLSWGARSREVGRWWGDQILNRALPAWALLAALWLVTRRLRPAAPQVAADVAPDAARALLLAFGLVPLLFVSMMALVSGAHVQLHWGTPYLLFVVPAALELAGGGAGLGGCPARRARRLPRGPGRPDAAHGAGGADRRAIARKPDDWRYFDSRALAEALHAPAMRALGGPVELVSGPPAEAGALALRLPERPLVLIKGEPRFSPWVPADLASRCGALELKRAPARPRVSSRWRPSSATCTGASGARTAMAAAPRTLMLRSGRHRGRSRPRRGAEPARTGLASAAPGSGVCVKAHQPGDAVQLVLGAGHPGRHLEGLSDGASCMCAFRSPSSSSAMSVAWGLLRVDSAMAMASACLMASRRPSSSVPMSVSMRDS